MATLDGARALGLDSEIGSLIPGKAADIIAVDFATPETEPLYHPISQLIYAAARQQVSDVWVAGQRRLANRQVVGADSESIIAAARAWSRKIGNSDAG
jgi:5-methylthioadenosine/S-adenosylhomocysteine deaminase